MRSSMLRAVPKRPVERSEAVRGLSPFEGEYTLPENWPFAIFSSTPSPLREVGKRSW